MGDEIRNSRIDEIIDVVMKVARGNFDVQLVISEEKNSLDALAIGINMMVDDLKKGQKAELENEEIKLLNIQLREANKKALESDRLKSVFLQNMSHEIRTPLNAIIGFSDMLVRNFDKKTKLKNFSAIIKQGGLDLLDLINDLLDLSRIETGQLPINIEECNLLELFNDLHLFFTNHSQKIGKAHIKLQQSIALSPRHNFIKIDTGKIKQIFINLIYNALKFTDMGKIEFGCLMNDNNRIDFFVLDTGVGIPAERQSIVFERFMQLGTGSTNVQKGSGLGLAIVKGLVELLGGEINLKSEVCRGTIFYFTVPYELADSTLIKTNSNELNATVNWNKHTVLIVEDDEYNIQYLEEILSETQINIVTATNAIDAIDIISSSRQIDIVLMDIKLPGMNGLEAMGIIKGIKPEIKIIIQSAYASAEDITNGEKMGCDAYICKPISSEILMETMNEILLNSTPIN
jgi:signal transduction histidine kinase/ActR/RegA family two-component response regulator